MIAHASSRLALHWEPMAGLTSAELLQAAATNDVTGHRGGSEADFDAREGTQPATIDRGVVQQLTRDGDG